MRLIHPVLPDGAAEGRHLPWFLAMEEHLANNYTGEYFFTWAVAPTVIFGRHQVIEAEVNLPFCRERGIEFYRRKSGGGCVYADSDNLMLCMVASSADVPATFARYCEAVADALRDLGVPAEVSGRNDITVGGRKVSGNSFLRIPPSRSIVHGTMLLDSDPETMDRALTPSRGKLESKGVQSVRSRVTTLREYLPGLTPAELDRHLVSHFCGDRTLLLTADDVAEIDRLAAPYFTPEWIYGHSPAPSTSVSPTPSSSASPSPSSSASPSPLTVARHTPSSPAPAPSSPSLRYSRRIEGAGEFLVSLALASDNTISFINLQGDFFLAGDLDALLGRLAGIPAERDAVARAIDDETVSATIPGLTAGALADLVAGAL